VRGRGRGVGGVGSVGDVGGVGGVGGLGGATEQAKRCWCCRCCRRCRRGKGRRQRGGGERESHKVLVMLREYPIERLFLANIRIVPLDGLLRRHPRDDSVFAPSELQRVALHRRRALYEHIEQRVVGRVFGMQEEQELCQLSAIELAVVIQVILLEPAAQARAAARVAHYRTQPGAAKALGLAGTTLF